ncbi:MAG: hypothetical protein ACJAQT_005223 [Akkermansiaceae bacterium]|jgi:hypothetical protein
MNLVSEVRKLDSIEELCRLVLFGKWGAAW